MAALAYPQQEILLAEDGIALAVDVVALLVEHVVVVEQVFADLKVAVLDPSLRLVYRQHETMVCRKDV